MQKAAATLATAFGLALITSPALAGGWGHSYYPEYYDYPSYGYNGGGCGSCCNGGGHYQPQNYQPVAAVAIAQGGPQRNGYRNGYGNGGGYYNGGGCGRRAYYGGCGRW